MYMILTQRIVRFMANAVLKHVYCPVTLLVTNTVPTCTFSAAIVHNKCACKNVELPKELSMPSAITRTTNPTKWTCEVRNYVDGDI